jgi:hypothetical protein
MNKRNKMNKKTSLASMSIITTKKSEANVKNNSTKRQKNNEQQIK